VGKRGGGSAAEGKLITQPEESCTHLAQVLCGAGAYADDGDCRLCPRGRYSEVAGSTACGSCPVARPYSVDGERARSGCSSCTTGCDDGAFGALWLGATCPPGHACDTSTHVMVRCILCDGSPPSRRVSPTCCLIVVRTADTVWGRVL
jgi:hypothetical protein